MTLTSSAGCAGSRGAPRHGDAHVARPAQDAIVVEAAFAAAIRDGNDVIGFPPRPRDSPAAPRRAVRHGGLRAGPLAVRLHHVEAAQPADPLVALLDGPADIPGTAADLPFVHAGITAERSSRGGHWSAVTTRWRRVLTWDLSILRRGFDMDDGVGDLRVFHHQAVLDHVRQHVR